MFKTWTLIESSGVSCTSCKYECLPSEKFQLAEKHSHFLHFACPGCFFESACVGEINSLLLRVMPSQEIRWISGPQQASLGTLADIEVPQGYRLTGETGARILLERMKNPVPDGLIGILAPDSGKWWVVLTFTDVGYVKNADKERIDPAAVLKAVQKRSEMQNSERAEQGMASIVSVDWERPPVYDAEGHSLEWALRADTQSSKVVNDTVLLLGRRGVLEIITVQPYAASSASVDLQQLIKNITFKEGQRYADYESGDKNADVSLSQLIIDDKHPAGSRNLMASSGGGVVVWIYSGLAGCVVMVVGDAPLPKAPAAEGAQRDLCKWRARNRRGAGRVRKWPRKRFSFSECAAGYAKGCEPAG